MQRRRLELIAQRVNLATFIGAAMRLHGNYDAEIERARADLDRVNAELAQKMHKG